MERSALRPGWIFACTFKAIGASPLSLLPLAGCALVMVVAGSALADPSSRPLVLVFGSLLAWVCGAISVQLLASGYWRLSGAPPLPASAALRSVKSLWVPVALGALWASALIVFGVAVFLVGALFGAGLALWVLCASSLEGRRGRAAVDRAWVLAGPSGVMWSTVALFIGGLVAWALISALEAVVGPAALGALPAIVLLFSLPFSFSAFLARRS